MEKKRIAVIMGGMSTEHDVSMKSGAQVLKALNSTCHEVKPVIISRNGEWKTLKGFGHSLEHTLAAPPVHISDGLKNLIEDRVEIAFLALHGQFGEDGTLQGLLELAGIPYTGSGVLGSALAMDKLRARQIMEYHGINVPLTLAYTRSDIKKRKDEIIREIVRVLKLPVVIKPTCGGSSVGTFIARSEEELPVLLEKTLEYTDDLLVEEFLKGTEVTCGVLEEPGKETLTVLPPTEIRPVGHTFFDYEAKYSGSSEEITPAPIEEHLTREVQRIASMAHLALNLSGFSRTDMIIRDGKIYVLETNTIPGLTGESLFPKAAKEAGKTFLEVVECLLQIAILHKEKKKPPLIRGSTARVNSLN